MPNKIKPKRSYTTNAVPTAADLEVNELAINWADGIAYTKDASGQIVSLTMGGGGGSSVDSRWNLFLPPAPTGLAGTGSDGQVALSWTAPTGVLAQTPVTDYIVQFSSDGGTNWATFADGTSTDTTATVTGLTNDTEYRFRVAAVNGVGTGSFSDSVAVTPSAVVDPTSVAGLFGWWDASDSTTLFNATSGGSLPSSGSAVARIEDKSGSGYHATSSTPMIRAASHRNSLDALQYNSVNNGYNLTASLSASDYTFIFAGDFSGNASGGGGYLLDVTTGRIVIAVAASASNYGVFTGAWAEPGTRVDGPQVVSFVLNSSGTSGKIFRNKSQVGSSFVYPQKAFGSTIYFLGKAPAAPSGYVYEVAFYDSALSDSDREAVETYLMSKWGIS